MSQTKIIHQFHNLLRSGKKPLVIWVGAGVSKWIGYPLWKDLAENMHSLFLKEENEYDKNKSLDLLKQNSFPEFFELCKATNIHLYNNFLAKTFESKISYEIHQRFCNLLKEILLDPVNGKPLHIITTNVDNAIEQNIPQINIIQNSNIERCISLIQDDKSFIYKAHGSISDVNSLVFTTTEYNSLLENSSYLNRLREIFSTCSILFVGYSLQDQYVIEQLLKNSSEKVLFGDGPHFACSSDVQLRLPDSVKSIQYSIDVYKDHRSVLKVFELMRSSLKGVDNKEPKSDGDSAEKESIYYLADIVAPGTWQNSLTIQLKREEDQNPLQMISGLGFNQLEMPKTIPTSLHDFVVGIMCFDKVYIKTQALAKVGKLLGDDLINELFANNILRLVYPELEPVIMYKHENVTGTQINRHSLSSNLSLSQL